MRTLGPAQVVIELIKILWSAKWNGIAGCEWQVSWKSHVDSRAEDRCCSVVAGKIQRWTNGSDAKWLIVVQTAEDRFELVHDCGTEYVSNIPKRVLAKVAVN